MKNIKWMAVAALATGMLFQLGSCGSLIAALAATTLLGGLGT